MPDGDGFRLTEGSAILRYLAEKVGSPAYPSDLRERARVNGTMDWLNANLHRDMGFNFVYPLSFPITGAEAKEAIGYAAFSEYSKWNIPTEHL